MLAQEARGRQADLRLRGAHPRGAPPIRLGPTNVILVDGILLFADSRLRPLFDIKIFVDVSDDVRFIRRLQRD